MKKILTSLSFLLVVTITAAQGISFKESNFTEALAEAKANDKLIFIDAYTTWCGPCKWMNKNVFVDDKVGEFFNDKFINLKIDMEKGEGLEIAKKYEVKAYPTFLFVDGKGRAVHRSAGSRPAEDFLDLGKASMDPDRQLFTMTKRYEAGEKTPDFLKKYVAALTSAGSDNFDVIAQQYMATQKDWSSEENMKFIFDYSDPSMESELFKYSVENAKAFKELVGAENYDMKLSYAADRDRAKAGIARTDKEKLQQHFEQYFGKDAAEMQTMETYINALMYSRDPKEQQQFLEEIQFYLADLPAHGSNFYNSVAWQVYEFSDDKDLLRKSAKWAMHSIEGEETSYNTDTYAAIQYKLGNMKKARKWAEKSIALAKESGDDFSATEELLTKINSK